MTGGDVMADRYRARDSVSWQKVDDEMVILDLASSTYSALNGSASVLWTAVVGAQHGATVDGLASALVDAFAIDGATAAADASAFVQDAVGRGLLEVSTH
ncbi:hypothetical protein ASF50_02685 [Nocardioides sp. Leaf307]|nr:hypothetical protein ASF50_02685 [Nocardioides sp. Leaf307]